MNSHICPYIVSSSGVVVLLGMQRLSVKQINCSAITIHVLIRRIILILVHFVIVKCFKTNTETYIK